ncbi:MAG: hypothetical protein U0795_09135 [Pirellulales bacterium]
MSDAVDDTTALLQALAGTQPGSGGLDAQHWLARLRSAGVPDRAAMECIRRAMRLREGAQRGGIGWDVWLYPAIVIAMAGLLAWWYATFTYPVMARFADSMHLNLPSWLAIVVRAAGRGAAMVLFALPLLWISRRWHLRSRVAGWWHTGRGSRGDQMARHAILSELAATLVAHDVPPREAVSTAIELTSDPTSLVGDTVVPSDGGVNLPPLLAASLIELDGSPQLANALHEVGRTYEELAAEDSRLWRSWLPALIVLTAAGLATLCYALLLFVPLIDMLKQLVIPLVSAR